MTQKMSRFIQQISGFMTVLLLCSLAPASADTSVFIYHRFGEERFPSTNIAPTIFAEQLKYLQKQGYQVLALSEIVKKMQAGQPLPDKSLGLSVDDAFVSFAETAWPLLRTYGFPVTLFVNTDSIGTSGYLGWAQIKELQRQGVEIGHHTASHAYLLELEADENFSQWQGRVRADIQRASAAFQEHLGLVPELFAYPYGEYHPVLADLLTDMGFSAAFAQQSGVVSQWSNNWALPRFPMGGGYATLEGFMEKVQMQALPVVSAEGVDPIVRQQNPPELRLRLQQDMRQFHSFNCFVQGQNTCVVQSDAQKTGVLRIKAQAPLRGRRNKYTLTAQGKDGRWYWFSQLWVQPQRPLEVPPQP